MKYYAVRLRHNTNLFITREGQGTFRHATLYTFTTPEAFNIFLTELPAQVELVEVAFNTITRKHLN